MSNLNDQIGILCERGEYEAATTLALQQLGPSIVRYIRAWAPSEDLAAEAYADFAEDLWRGMKGFAGRSSVRVWAFAIARNAVRQALRKQRRERKRSRTWSSSLACRIAEEVRTRTVEYMRTETKDRFSLLRQRLTAEEQTLLVLRINERMSWDEIARIQAADLSEAELKREAARLRKRFQLVRDKLRRMARAEGLIGQAGDLPDG